MSCMCGDTQCWSCGPAQGNFKCVICGKWADDCCEHIGETMEYLPQFAAEAERIEKETAEAEYLIELDEKRRDFA